MADDIITQIWKKWKGKFGKIAEFRSAFNAFQEKKGAMDRDEKKKRTAR